jgi:hypothetical protein
LIRGYDDDQSLRLVENLREQLHKPHCEEYERVKLPPRLSKRQAHFPKLEGSLLSSAWFSAVAHPGGFRLMAG